MGGPIEGRHLVLLAADAGYGAPGPVPVAVCGLCSALVSVEHDGELRHLRAHAQAGPLGPDEAQR